ncbi:2Fe-2S iron-sulfur cluster-binding protein [Yoonia sp. SS1-5]|uniref:2Fe-2S iron-sulfur cluster-binding protein n=1 Tax=Yoonia rhodophyticola TaxID=3137370 RepID=A0ABZ3JBW8_9RHOB
MFNQFRSQKNRPMHLGRFPLENATRQQDTDLQNVPPFVPLSFVDRDRPQSLVNAMREHQAMMDAIRDGTVNGLVSETPDDLEERSNHLKSFGYFCGASMASTGKLPSEAILTRPYLNEGIAELAQVLRTRQSKSLAPGHDLLMAELRESMEAPPGSIDTHTHAIVYLFEHPRTPDPDEPGADWIMGAEDHRSALLASEAAVVVATYLRQLGHSARAHTASSADIDLNKLAVATGLAAVVDGQVSAPFIGSRFGMAAVTTSYPVGTDLPLVAAKLPKSKAMLYAKRRFKDGAHPFEKIKRVDAPTTYIDEGNVARLPKRSDMLIRAAFGDLGKPLQQKWKGGYATMKSPTSPAQRRPLSAFALLQNGPVAECQIPYTPQEAHDHVKAATYFLSVDGVGVSRCPDWAYYSHNAAGEEVIPSHDQAISMVIDQGFDTMEGASGDDWISVAQSMRGYLRFALLGGVIAHQIRNVGYPAKAHTMVEGEVIQPPLLLLSGLGEVSRIGEVILNPYLGPRLKSGVVTTELPMSHDKPIDFGLQKFCDSCKKCARECPSGAITAGPKLMHNGYEIWKSDSQKCATYRVSNLGGGMCGRCMKTCPWNLEGVLADAAWRWTAMKVPGTAPALAKLDDMLDRGQINPVKKWWWDLEVQEDGAFRPTKHPVNERALQKDLDLKYEDQTLAVVTPALAPPPHPFPSPLNREDGIEAYQAMVTAEVYKERMARGDTDGLINEYTVEGENPAIQVEIAKAEVMAEGVTKYELRAVNGHVLPEWEAGAHLDIVVAPEYLRQYSLSGCPSDRSKYQIGVLREDEGSGGSKLLHRIFTQGRKVFVSRPINHFPLVESASKTYLMAGGIGITAMMAMAHRLHAIGAEFELHYSGRSRRHMGFLDDLQAFAWADRVKLHISDEGSRADLSQILTYTPGAHVYTCGAEAYMQSVMDAAEACGFPEDARHLEYFSVPEAPEYEDHPFVVRIASSGQEFDVPIGKSVADVLNENDISIDLKCGDGICGVCKCGVTAGAVEHRDFVLSKAQRETTMITCQSRAATAGETITLDL